LSWCNKNKILIIEIAKVNCKNVSD
jgi:hypothetical protein